MPRRPGFTAGFSLLELLVVVVIIGILATMLTLSVGITGTDRDLEREADRLQALVAMAGEDALIRGRQLGMRFYRGGYEFVELNQDQNQWERVTGDDLLRPRELPEDVVLTLDVDGRELVLAATPETVLEEDDAEGETADANYLPQIFIYSSGDIAPPFAARLRRRFDNEGLTVAVTADGKAEVQRDTL